MSRSSATDSTAAIKSVIVKSESKNTGAYECGPLVVYEM
jgi:hypothetical protein